MLSVISFGKSGKLLTTAFFLFNFIKIYYEHRKPNVLTNILYIMKKRKKRMMTQTKNLCTSLLYGIKPDGNLSIGDATLLLHVVGCVVAAPPFAVSCL